MDNCNHFEALLVAQAENDRLHTALGVAAKGSMDAERLRVENELLRESVETMCAENGRLRATIARVREYAGTHDLHEAAESWKNEGTYAYGFARGEASVMAGLREVLDGKPEVEWGYAPDGTAVPISNESGISGC